MTAKIANTMEATPLNPAQDTRPICLNLALKGSKIPSTDIGRAISVMNNIISKDGRTTCGSFARCNQQTKQEENHHLADTGNHIEKVYQIPFSRKIGVSHQNTAQVNAQISISPSSPGRV